ncbi:MAG: triose-phosphate isomerase, partial [Desulfovibrio sp.]|nr:triose-phosphate isomerase [Desulfovibrio sp.]
RSLVPRGARPAWRKLAIAYEPVWAIGTGKVAEPQEIIDAHAEVRDLLRGLVGDMAKDLPILYGGSVKANNAGAILALDNVDGLLVGGASLEATGFLEIIGA